MIRNKIQSSQSRPKVEKKEKIKFLLTEQIFKQCISKHAALLLTLLLLYVSAG